MTNEKRELLAKAAENRTKNWRQTLNPVNNHDRLITQIEQWYYQHQQTPPFGLASCNSQQLKIHYQAIKKGS